MSNYLCWKYGKAILINILEHIDDDDYFYNKKGGFEDWVIMRIDIKRALKKHNITSIGDICHNTAAFYSVLDILNN